MTRRGLLRALPAGLGALAMAACALLLLADMVAASVLHAHVRLVPGLIGATLPRKPRWSLAGVLDGTAQAAFAQGIGTQMPLHPWAVRLRNEVEYELFDHTPLPSLMIGRHGNLLEAPYETDWCSRDVAAWRPGAVRWAGSIREMQEAAERRGHAFLYVLTPSKVAQYPEYLPKAYACPSTQADRAGLLPAWRAILHEAGVHVGDAAAAVSKAHAEYPFPPYPQGGIHWNAVGAAVGQGAILGGLDRLMPGRGLTPEPFTWAMRPHATGSDRDLANLMNLFSALGRGPVPAVTARHLPPPSPCRPPRVVIVGGSFGHQTLETLSQLACPVPVVEYEYWSAYTLGWNGGGITVRRGVDAPVRDADVLAADVLIYEENEETLSHPAHGQALWCFLNERAPS